MEIPVTLTVYFCPCCHRKFLSANTLEEVPCAYCRNIAVKEREVEV